MTHHISACTRYLFEGPGRACRHVLEFDYSKQSQVGMFPYALMYWTVKTRSRRYQPNTLRKRGIISNPIFILVVKMWKKLCLPAAETGHLRRFGPGTSRVGDINALSKGGSRRNDLILSSLCVYSRQTTPIWAITFRVPEICRPGRPIGT